MFQDSSVSLPPNSQSAGGETATAPKPTSQWKIWSRGINEGGDWHCTHKFEDKTQTWHYVHENGSVYMRHRDDSATYVPVEGTYIPRKECDSGSKIPAPTMEEIIEEYEEIKKEHREYLARPLNYWNGVCTTLQPRRGHPNVSWLFSTCDCGDRYSIYDNDYPSYDYADDYGNGYEDADYYEMALEEYEDYEHSSEDEEEDCSDGSRDSSPSLNEHELTIKQEDDKTTACMTDGAHLPAAEEANVDAKQEIKEEALDGPVIMRLIDPGLDKQEAPTAPVPNAALESAAAGSGTGERTSHSSGVGPDVQTEAKRILRSHRSKPY